MIFEKTDKMDKPLRRLIKKKKNSTKKKTIKRDRIQTNKTRNEKGEITDPTKNTKDGKRLL